MSEVKSKPLGRPRIHPDRKAYRAAWMRKWREKKRAALGVVIPIDRDATVWDGGGEE